MPTRPQHVGAAGSPSALDSATGFAAASVVVLEDLASRLPAGMGALEVALAARTRAACARLLECAARLAADELMVTGSTGQLRPHPMLKVEQELRKEIAAALADLTFRVEQRAIFVRLSSLTAAKKPR